MKGRIVPVFLTVNNDNSERNPRSAVVVDRLQARLLELEEKNWSNKMGAMVLHSLEDLEMARAIFALQEGHQFVPVTIFDSIDKVECWSFQFNHIEHSTPAWARDAAWCGVRIGSLAVASPEQVERCAREISSSVLDYLRLGFTLGDREFASPLKPGSPATGLRINFA
ncbi:MAG: hypothetical protein AAB641_00985 [Patescibacteria group bacterium]